MVLLVVMGLVGPAAGDPNVRRDEEAFADWMIPTGVKNEFHWYGAYASRSTVVGAGKWFSGASFLKGRCIREKTPKYTSTECWSTDHVSGDPDSDFEMSPLANEARLRVRHKGEIYDVRWNASPTAGGLYSHSEYCFSMGEEGEPEEEGQGEGAGLFNPADARGKLFGRRFTGTKKSSWTSLSVGVVATTCSFRSIDYDPETSTFHVTIRVPR